MNDLQKQIVKQRAEMKARKKLEAEAKEKLRPLTIEFSNDEFDQIYIWWNSEPTELDEALNATTKTSIQKIVHSLTTMVCMQAMSGLQKTTDVGYAFNFILDKNLVEFVQEHIDEKEGALKPSVVQLLHDRIVTHVGGGV